MSCGLRQELLQLMVGDNQLGAGMYTDAVAAELPLHCGFSIEHSSSRLRLSLDPRPLSVSRVWS